MNSRKKFALIFWITCGVIGLGCFIAWLVYFRDVEFTNDAYVHGNQVPLTPLHEGFVTSIHTDDTFLVKKGDLLVTLDESDAQIGLEKAKYALSQTVRNVCELYHQVFVYRAEIELKTAELIRDAQDYLHRNKVYCEGAVSVEDYEHAIANLRASFAALTMTHTLYRKALSAVQNVSIQDHPLVVAASERLRDAWLYLYRCKIYAPVDGLVAQRTIQVGMWIEAGQPLMSIIPLNQIWVNANYKETQLRAMRLGQKVDITVDLWGPEHTFQGEIVGLPGGAGNVFSLLPPQNLSGNWIKIVQRLPVRVALDSKEIAHFPLRLGLSCHARVHTNNQSGEQLPDTTKGSPSYDTSIFDGEERGVLPFINEIIAQNLDPNLTPYAKAPLDLPEITMQLPPLIDEAFAEDRALQQQVDACSLQK